MMDDKDFMNNMGEEFSAGSHSPMSHGVKNQFVQQSPGMSSHHLHSNTNNNMQLMSFEGTGGMQPTVMWNVDSGVRHPGEKPKRPLSAYNFYFQLERERIINGDIKDKDSIADYSLEDVARIALIQQRKAKENKPKEKRSHRKTHGKISFGDLARTIANKWKKLDDKSKAIFEGSAAIEKERYKKELTHWNKQQKKWKDMTSRMPVMTPMMFPGGNAGPYNLVTPPQMPKKTVTGGRGGDRELLTTDDAMAVAMMNQKLMNEYSDRSVTPRSAPSSTSNMMPLSRRPSTGSFNMSPHGLQQRQQGYGMDFFDNSGDDGMHGMGSGMNNDFCFQQSVGDNFHTDPSAFASPGVSPNDFHNRAIISQQRNMQIMLMQRQQKIQQEKLKQQQQQIQQQEPSQAAMMEKMMMMMMQRGQNAASRGHNGLNESFMHNDQLYDDSINMDASGRSMSNKRTYGDSPDSFQHSINNFGSVQHSPHNHHHQA